MQNSNIMKQVFNPYLPSYEYIPDGEPYVFDGRLYVFGSHDRFGAMSFCENDYVTWSAPIDDLSDWRYEGVIFKREQDPLNPEGIYPLFAPDVQKARDGQYYLYYAPGGTFSIGVAVCEKPGGKYRFYGHVHDKQGNLLGQRPDDANPFDPGVFLDDDGQVYLYYGFSPLSEEMKAVKAEKENPMLKFAEGPHVVRLESDMVTMSEEPLKIEISNCPIEGHDFFEASSMRKINGVYYFIYSSKNSHELCYATGDSPVGPFAYGGVLLSNGDIGYGGRTDAERVTYTGNNHGSLVEVKNQWYIFGHRMTNYTAFSRQGIAEPVNIAADGSIAQAELTSCGLNNGPLMGQGKYEARIACALQSKTGAGHYIDGCTDEAGMELRKNHPVFCQDGEDREENPDQYIGNMKDGSAAGFKYFVFNDSCNISVTTRGDSGCFKISQEIDGKVVAEIPIEAGKEWHDSEVVSFVPGQGKSALYFTYAGNGVIDFMTFTLN